MERDLSALGTGLDALSIAHTRQGVFYPWGRPDVSRTGLKQPALSVAEGPVLDEHPSAACSMAAVAVVRTGLKHRLGWIPAAQSQTHASRRQGRGRITSHVSRIKRKLVPSLQVAPDSSQYIASLLRHVYTNVLR
jgi:hypothetical protein